MPDQNNPTDTSISPTQVNPPSEPTQMPTIPPAPMDIPVSDASIPPPFPPESSPIDGSTPPSDFGSAAPSFDIPPVITPGQPNKKFGGKRVIATILGLLVLVGGLGAGVILVRQQQDIREKASINEPCNVCIGGNCIKDASPPDCIASLNQCPNPGGSCGPYPPPTSSCDNLTATPWQSCPSECAGTVKELATCTLGAKKWKCTGKQWQPNYGDVGDCKTSCPWPTTSGKCCPVKPDACSKPGEIICIDDPFASKCVEWDLSCPSGQQYYYKAIDWSSDLSEIEARNQCGSVPYSSPGPGGPSAQCLNIKAYDTSWNLLTSDQLKAPNAGDKIRFTVGGTTTGGSFDKAKFKINGVQRPEVTQKRPTTEEYFDEYTIPEAITTFTINAQIHHTTLGWSN